MQQIHRHILKFIISGIFLFLFFQQKGYAQEDSLRELIIQKIPRPWFNGIRIGTDLVPVGKSFYQHLFPNYELNIDFGVKKFFVEADYGFSTFQLKGDNYEYESRGRYTRLGISYNLIKERTAKNVLFIGAKWCWADFEDKTNFTIQNTYWNFSNEIQREKVKQKWIEALVGTKIYVWKNIYLGCTLHYKIRITPDQSSNLEAYYTPGYGLNIKKHFEFSYHIYYRIPFVRAKLLDYVQK